MNISLYYICFVCNGKHVKGHTNLQGLVTSPKWKRVEDFPFCCVWILTINWHCFYNYHSPPLQPKNSGDKPLFSPSYFYLPLQPSLLAPSQPVSLPLPPTSLITPLQPLNSLLWFPQSVGQLLFAEEGKLSQGPTEKDSLFLSLRFCLWWFPYQFLPT